jgi:hypothetical protein
VSLLGRGACRREELDARDREALRGLVEGEYSPGRLVTQNDGAIGCDDEDRRFSHPDETLEEAVVVARRQRAPLPRCVAQAR